MPNWNFPLCNAVSYPSKSVSKKSLALSPLWPHRSHVVDPLSPSSGQTNPGFSGSLCSPCRLLITSAVGSRSPKLYTDLHIYSMRGPADKRSGVWTFSLHFFPLAAQPGSWWAWWHFLALTSTWPHSCLGYPIPALWSSKWSRQNDLHPVWVSLAEPWATSSPFMSKHMKLWLQIIYLPIPSSKATNDRTNVPGESSPVMEFISGQQRVEQEIVCVWQGGGRSQHKSGEKWKSKQSRRAICNSLHQSTQQSCYKADCKGNAKCIFKQLFIIF